jgi:hypothetical protein
MMRIWDKVCKRVYTCIYTPTKEMVLLCVDVILFGILLVLFVVCLLTGKDDYEDDGFL